MTSESRSPETVGPILHPANPVANAAGSIHDDAVAQKLGFKGGTIPGDALMDLYPPFLAQQFGKPWFEEGTLSLYFRQALEGGDPVRPVLESPPQDAIGERTRAESVETGQRKTRLETPDGRCVAEGTVSVGESDQPSALYARDLRPVAADQLRILKEMKPGETIPTHRVELPAERQAERLKRGFGGGFSAAIPEHAEVASWHQEQSPWGPAIALPSTAIGLLLYLGPRQALTPRIGDSVGLFGAIELCYRNGPILLDRSYDIHARVAALSDSPKTESLWFDSDATLADEPDVVVASMRMMLRFMKASSPLY